MILGRLLAGKNGRLIPGDFIQVADTEKNIEKFQLSNPDLGFFIPPIKRVIFAEKKTIVIWVDGTKTSVECHEGDTYDKQTGFCMAVCKKLFHGLSTVDRLIKKKSFVPKKHKKEKEDADKKSSI